MLIFLLGFTAPREGHPSLSDKPTLPLLTFMPTNCGGALRIVQRVGANYKMLGTLLLNDDSGAITEAIIVAHHQQPAHITDSILSKWLQGGGRKPVTWATFIAVLNEVGLTELAEDIENQLESLDPPPPKRQCGMTSISIFGIVFVIHSIHIPHFV